MKDTLTKRTLTANATLSKFKANEAQKKTKKQSVKTAITESQVQAQILSYLQLHKHIAWAARINTGATKTDNRFIRFGFKGCSDIIGQTNNGNFLAIEIKKPKPKTYATKDQKAFLQKVFNNNGFAGVARSIEDVDSILSGELIL